MRNKIQLFALILMLSLTGYNAQATEATTHALTAARAMEIKQRVDQIRTMDMDNLTTVQRTDLKHELKDMKHELRQNGPGGIYISVGALIIIIIILLIIL